MFYLYWACDVRGGDFQSKDGRQKAAFLRCDLFWRNPGQAARHGRSVMSSSNHMNYDISKPQIYMSLSSNTCKLCGEQIIVNLCDKYTHKDKVIS